MSKIILIVEDYEDARAYMQILIEFHGYEVYETGNGLEAVEVARDYHPDPILMDLSIPIMDGLTATQIIRQSIEERSQVAIICVTAFGDSFKEKELAAGCDHLVAKPIDFETQEPRLNHKSRFLLPVPDH